MVGQVLPGKPAAGAGIQEGDTILAVNGMRITQWYDLLELLQANPGKPLKIDVSRAGNQLSFSLTSSVDSVPGPDGKPRVIGRIGVAVGTGFIYEPLTLGQAVVDGWNDTIRACSQTIRTVRGLLTGRVSGRNVGGPILIGQLAGESARLGLDTFLGFMALISISLAIMNLLPVPVLDGGQFLFLLTEAVIRRPVPMKLRERLTTVGMVLIILLMGLAFSNDIRRMLGG